MTRFTVRSRDRIVFSRMLAIGCLLALSAFFATPASGQTSPITKGTVTVKLQRLGTVSAGTDGTPQDLVDPGDGRLFVATRNGNVRIFSGGAFSSTPFLSLTSRGVSVYTGGEGGLLGEAFSPTFNAPAGTPGSGKFYTLETEPVTTTPDFTHPELGTGGNNSIVVREWSVSASNPNIIDPSIASRVLLRINHPQSNHQGGSLRFGPDGNLYIGLGDGGGANDNNGGANNPSDGHTNSTGNAQDTSVVFGKILRINPLGTNSAHGQYGIPADNPLAAATGNAVKEIYAYGLRNPYKFSFDAATGKLYVGDVGQGAREEVDIVTSGGNYGWVFREGTRNNSADSGRTPPAGFTSIPPIAEYTHGDGNAVIGGYVYRGSTVPDLVGNYVFGDLAGTANAGRLFYVDAAGGTIHELRYDPSGITIPSGANLYGFGQDHNGDLYAFFSNGDILRIVPEPSALGCVGLGLMLIQRRRRSMINVAESI